MIGPVTGDEKAKKAMMMAMMIAGVMRPANLDDGCWVDIGTPVLCGVELPLTLWAALRFAFA